MHSQRSLLLAVDDDHESLTHLGTIAQEEGFEVVTPAHADDAMTHLRRRPAALVLLDVAAPGVRGTATLRALRRLDPDSRVALMSAPSMSHGAVDAVTAGATDYLVKPLNPQRVRSLLVSVRDEVKRRRSVLALEAELADRLEFCGMVGRSPAMLEVFDRIRRLAPHAPVALVTGEAGTGKRLAARSFHQLGPARYGHFAPVACSAVVETLLDSELFGHVAGAFPGATGEKAGVIETAQGGVIFLDEIAALPRATQGKLLAAIESGEARRLGSMERRPVDVRVVAATRRDLRADVAAGRFSTDLYRLFTSAEIRLPPLRDRAEDIRHLTASMIRRFAQRFAKPVCGLAPSAEHLLASTTWEGNVRQLRDVLEHACIVAAGEFITRAELASVLARQSVHDATARLSELAAASGAFQVDAPVPLVDVERDHILRTLDQVRGNKAVAARLLGVSRRAFYRQLERHGLHTRVAADAGATSTASTLREQHS